MKPDHFLARMAETANQLDLESHMSLISKNVKVYGIPGFDVITYDDWYRQCEHEFSNNVLKGVSYQGMDVLANMPDSVTFKSIETVEANDGQINTNLIEFIISKEDDGEWRVTQERILPAYELAAAQTTM